MVASFKFIKAFITLIGERFFSRVIKYIYILYYPLDQEFCQKLNFIFQRNLDKNRRINEINISKVNIVGSTLWAHAGTVFAFGLTVYSMVVIFFSNIFYINGLNPLYCKSDSLILKRLAVILLVLVLPYIITILVSPVLLKRIIEHLPRKTYASLSLSGLNQSQILTFIAMKYWEMCNKFTKKVAIPKEIDDLVKAEDIDSFTKVYKKVKNERKNENIWVDLFRDINLAAKKYKANEYKRIENAKALKREAVLKLNILPIEFGHHVLKFSPAIFESRLNSLIRTSESLTYLLQSPGFGLRENYFSFKEALLEIVSIIDDIELRRKRSLFQIAALREIHDYIIGLASVTSTSQSLKVFMRGLSELIDTSDSRYKEEFSKEPFLSLLHRSKAHYGFDLLITLENFYKKNYPESDARSEIPQLLYKIKHNKYMPNFQDEKLLKNMSENLVEQYGKAMKAIKNNFYNKIKELSGDNIYLMVFGYSKIVKQTLLLNQAILIEKGIKIFVMKESNQEMLDTRMFRFGLNDSKQNSFRHTFTSSDDLFKRLLRKDDTLIMVAGAEAYDLSQKRLFHTNNYQKRVEGFLTFLQLSTEAKKPKPQVWIIAGSYKIYDKFPDTELLQRSFKSEFFADHYDKLDLYNFSDFDIDPVIISE